jgi:endonuclease/exonuclease/phosphatase family metal-dependent hydrolase
MHAPRTLNSAAAAVAIAAGIAAGQTYVSVDNGAFNPTGASGTPYNSVGSGVCGAPVESQLVLEGGAYYESGTFSKPVTITGDDGLVTISAPEPGTTTRINIVSYNTHLFGQDDIPGLPRWLDAARALYIAFDVRDEPADIFCMQEVWDPDLFNLIRVNCNYPSGFYGGDREFGDVLHSGLFTVARHHISEPAQFIYSSENGFFESMASKGFIRTTFVKDGFPVTVFNTHTQSGEGGGDLDARADQLVELAVSIQVWRVLHPTHVVLAVGDFNVIGENIEYYTSMLTSMGVQAGTQDGAQNQPCAGNSDDCTSCADNELHHYFDPDGGDKRLDYVLYAHSFDGSVKVLPLSYRVRRFEVPEPFPAMSDDGLTTRTLSDHDGVQMVLELQRY